MEHIGEEADVGGIASESSGAPCTEVWRQGLRLHFQLVELPKDMRQPLSFGEPVRKLKRAEK